ncbi:MAG: calycin-like domain-containing protein [Prevotellaceae bacterium]|jgi:hypothetical protein|nr:calycin-like domain-containing protein [Prevotellaceae bacterium]
MKKIYLTFVLALAAFVGAAAQTGYYTGTITVALGGTPIEVPAQTIALSSTSITISNLDLSSYPTIPLAGALNIEIDELVTTQSGDGYTLTREGTKSINVLTTLSPTPIPAEVALESGSIDADGKLVLDLDIDAGLPVSIDVKFEGVYSGALPAGLYDTAENGATAVAYYSILGKKLNAEPANGVFIVKYSNGKSLKVVK